MAELAIFPAGGRPPAQVAELAAAIDRDGGAAMVAYQEPLGRHWQIFALLPADQLKPTPYQRDLSPAHTKRLIEVMKRLDRFLDPVIAVRMKHEYWTPNGNHRRAAAVKLGIKMIPAIVLPETEAAFQILALNTEKAHNLRDKSLEVIRMYRGMIEEGVRGNEREMAFEFERPHYITLGLLYERKPKFSGGAFAPILSRVDTFIAKPLREAIGEREERADLLDRADDLLSALVAKGKKRGLTHPYLKNFIVARCNPLTRARKNMPSYKSALGGLCKSLEEFDLSRIHFGQLSAAAQIAAASSVQ